MMKLTHKQFGFTLVELVIVIVVIGLLAALTTISFNNVQIKTKATNEMSDLKAINRAIQAYYSENSAYPSTNTSWTGWGQDWGQGQNTLSILVPKYIAKLPQQTDTTKGANYTYLYISNGVNYKLISYKVSNPDPVCSAAITITPTMADPQRTNSSQCYAFGIWSTSPDGLTTGADW